MPRQKTNPVLERHHFAHDLRVGTGPRRNCVPGTASAAIPAESGWTAIANSLSAASWVSVGRRIPPLSTSTACVSFAMSIATHVAGNAS